jgi:hypothetical protein
MLVSILFSFHRDITRDRTAPHSALPLITPPTEHLMADLWTQLHCNLNTFIQQTLTPGFTEVIRESKIRYENKFTIKFKTVISDTVT